MPTSIFDLGVAEFEINDIQVFANNLDGTFGAGIDVPSANLFVMSQQIDSVEGTGDGRITVARGTLRKADVRLTNVSIPYLANQVMTGFPVQSSGGTRMSIKVGAGRAMPLFAVVGRAGSAQSAGGTLVALPALMITQPFDWSFGYNQLTSQEIRCTAYGDPVLLDDDGFALLWHIQKYKNTVPQIVMPLPA